MRKRIRKLGLLALMVVCMGVGITARAGTVYENPDVEKTPDNYAWTIQESLPHGYYLEYFEKEGVTPDWWYEKGERIETGITSSIRELEIGEHYYGSERKGEVPVKYWEVVHSKGGCIHNDCKVSDWHGVENVGVEGNGNPCKKAYYSGWYAYCADCGGQLTHALVYMSKNAAEAITSIDVDKGYYYRCPFCFHIENTIGPLGHECQAISWNQYEVVYNANTGIDTPGGYMAKSYHMYNNETERDGIPQTPVTHLTPNAYFRDGYVFDGWNTKPNGSGLSFVDGQEIYNLSKADWKYPETWTAEDNGTVILYAQWKKSENTLTIDANGGTYNGETSVSITKPYRSAYEVNGEVIPPVGCRVTFEENGGTEVEDKDVVAKFTDWTQVPEFKGRMKGNTYYFLAPNSHTDVLRANYNPGDVILPETVKENSSFGGWYYDAAFTLPAGGVGDSINPEGDVTLYANWVDLLLTAEDNYTANDGKGAVDLSWSQPDGQDKTYMIYQSRDQLTWKQITSSEDVGNPEDVSEVFTYYSDSNSGTYTIPYSGIYTLTASGAQGGNYDIYKGGYGGEVTARVWFNKGEVIAYSLGGQDGTNGGGEGTVYGNGGGRTNVYTERYGTFIIAGGGGGATENGDGGAGGANTSLRDDDVRAGENGQAGGGAGYVGGNAGEYITHAHEENCYHETDLSYEFSSFDANSSMVWDGHIGDGTILSATSKIYAYVHTNSDYNNYLYVDIGNSVNPIVTNGNTKLSIPLYFYSWGDTGYVMDGAYLKVFDQTGQSLKDIDMSNQYTSIYDMNYTNHYEIGTEASPVVFDIALPEGTTGIYMSLYIPVYHQGIGSWVTLDIGSLSFSGGVQRDVICGKTEGQIMSSKPAHGGSSYANPSAVLSYSSNPGTRIGNGQFTITSDILGFVYDNSMEGVEATDYAAPNKISEDTVIRESVSSSSVKITWAEPEDNGTVYYHVAESYLAGSSSRLSLSNKTENTLVSGVTGYYYLLDENPDTVVTIADALAAPSGKGGFLPEAAKTVDVTDAVQYLHVAAVDKAENISETVHIEIDGNRIDWKLYTEQLVIEEGENVYPASMDKTWYVRADGVTPFLLKHKAFMDGTATKEYQPNYTIYETVIDGEIARNVIYTASHDIKDGEIVTYAADLIQTMEGQSYMKPYMYSVTRRTEKNQRILGEQKFILPYEAHGKYIDAIPVIGADRNENIIYSNHDEDIGNSITLIGDGEGPEFVGLELLMDKELINKNEGPIFLNVEAVDNLSGVREFYMEITNTDNFGRVEYHPDEHGIISVDITAEESIFGGDFVVTAYAVDNVGNESKTAYSTTEFALVAEVKSILEPHDSVFRCGESGMLTITTWGYADRVEVEFPAELTSVDPGLNKTYVYTDSPMYIHTEEQQFVIPLNTPTDRIYTITVRAYKGEKQLEGYPTIRVIAGSILDSIRTRLR